MRERGGVLSIDLTVSSRQEQAAASETPRTAIAGRTGYSGFEIAARANTRTSSIRFTTHTLVASTFLYFPVSRNGLSTGGSSPPVQSTPIGAMFTAPLSSMVVT